MSEFSFLDDLGNKAKEFGGSVFDKVASFGGQYLDKKASEKLEPKTGEVRVETVADKTPAEKPRHLQVKSGLMSNMPLIAIGAVAIGALIWMRK